MNLKSNFKWTDRQDHTVSGGVELFPNNLRTHEVYPKAIRGRLLLSEGPKYCLLYGAHVPGSRLSSFITSFSGH